MACILWKSIRLKISPTLIVGVNSVLLYMSCVIRWLCLRMDIQIVQRDSRRWSGALIFNQWVKPTDNEGGFNSIDISVVLLQFEKRGIFSTGDLIHVHQRK